MCQPCRRGEQGKGGLAEQPPVARALVHRQLMEQDAAAASTLPWQACLASASNLGACAAAFAERAKWQRAWVWQQSKCRPS